MVRLEQLTHGAVVRGILPNRLVTLVAVTLHGTEMAEIVYKDADGKVGTELLLRDREPGLEIVTAGRPWSFDGDGKLFRLASEAHRIRLAYLFDPYLAVHSSNVDALPHQLTAVYEEMLTRQPLRFLLADDPGAGKTIMTGLLIKELQARGDLARCLIVCPGSLVEQWQDELHRRFHLPFAIVTNDAIAASRTGNPFEETPLAICRLDKLSRDDALQEAVAAVDWDLIVCDEAHKLSASYFGSEVKYTKRYRLGQRLSAITRHFLLLTATPHNGKDPDFQLFMALLDADRFEGSYRQKHGTTAPGDLMRRLVKEQLLTFDGTPLFPERRAYTKPYTLSPEETQLYDAVTTYVREEFDRADDLQEGGRRGTIGFALTILQRRLASSPEAIYQSLRRRRERLEARLREEQTGKRGDDAALSMDTRLPTLTEDALDDLDDAPDAEIEATEEALVDRASAARTVRELEAEIATLRGLEALAHRLRLSYRDRKWDELSRLLQDEAAMRDTEGHRRKLVIFTEHRDILTYLAGRLRDLLGTPEAVVTIHGGMGRDERRTAEHDFMQNKEVSILVATDAAGEGINLQRANLMVNYDLPWNPNRLEQRFGRIHRIGQTEVCHLWNLVATETREGEVFARLLTKIEEERKALNGGVFDILGKVTFGDKPLRELLIEAVRYGDSPAVRARLTQVVEGALDREHLRDLLEERALVRDTLDVSKVQAIRADIERAETRRLQPHFIAAFFLKAFAHLGGTVHERERGRYEVTHVPAPLRGRARTYGREAVAAKYERITFEKALVSVPGKPLAEFVSPGHPLLDATRTLLLERYRDLLTRGTVLVDPTDPGERVRVLCTLEHTIRDGTMTATGESRIASRQLQFVELDADGTATVAGFAPYLDYRPLLPDEDDAVLPLRDLPWVRADIAERATAHAMAALVMAHYTEVKARREAQVTRAMAAVHERLTAEISYWDIRAVELEERERAGKQSNNPNINSQRARQRANDLTARLTLRIDELKREQHLTLTPPVIVGGALVVPQGLVDRLMGRESLPDAMLHARDTARVERLAMDATLAAERALNHGPRDVSGDKVGYDIESTDGVTGRLRFIEVKGRVAGATTVTVTKNEITTAINQPEAFILSLVSVADDTALPPRYVRQPFHREPDFDTVSVNYHLPALLARATEPS